MKLKLSSFSLKITLVIVFLFFLTKSNAQATIASWTYDPVLGTPSNPTPNVGSGSSSVVNLGVTPSTTQGLNPASSGCSSSTSSGNNAWHHQNFDPGSSNEKNGIQYYVSTFGYSGIKLSWDQYFSDSAPNTVRLQYTIDGINWVPFAMTNPGNTTKCAGTVSGGCFVMDNGGVFRRVTVDFTGIAGVENNPNFGIRILASHYPTTSQFRKCSDNTSQATNTGTWRFDNVNFTGTPTTPGAVISGTATICSGSTNIKVTISGGTPPYTVVYTDLTTSYTVLNYSSGNNIQVTPGSTKTYTLVSVSGIANTLLSGAAVITVPTLTPTITSTGTAICTQTPITFTTEAGMDSYTWTITSNPINSTYTTTSTLTGVTANEAITITPTITSGTATYTANVTYTSGGCSTSTSTTTTAYALPTALSFITSPALNNKSVSINFCRCSIFRTITLIEISNSIKK